MIALRNATVAHVEDMERATNLHRSSLCGVVMLRWRARDVTEHALCARCSARLELARPVMLNLSDGNSTTRIDTLPRRGLAIATRAGFVLDDGHGSVRFTAVGSEYVSTLHSEVQGVRD